MTQDVRPPDWDWVTATALCRAEVMFGRLRELAKRDVELRNQQVNKVVYEVTDIDGIQFSVSKKHDGWQQPKAVYFRVSNDLRQILVTRFGSSDEVTYEVGLNDKGLCKLRRGQELLDLWQVLKASLEPVLFG